MDEKPSKKQVKMLTSLAGSRYSFRPGQKIPLDADEADRLIKAGFAEEVTPDSGGIDMQNIFAEAKAAAKAEVEAEVKAKAEVEAKAKAEAEAKAKSSKTNKA